MKPKLPSGQKLADEMARMIGIFKDENEWEMRRHTHAPWQPHISYDQCRIVEDFIHEKGLWTLYASILLAAINPKATRNINLGSRATATERCQAAWLAWKESKGKDLTKASKLGYYP